jgi:hypothetical protein
MPKSWTPTKKNGENIIHIIQLQSFFHSFPASQNGVCYIYGLWQATGATDPTTLPIRRPGLNWIADSARIAKYDRAPQFCEA